MDFVSERLSRVPQWAKITTFVALPAASAGFVLARFLDDYRGWLAMGPGGLPYNVGGYLKALSWTALFAWDETTSLDIYSNPEKYAVGWKQASSDEKANAQKSFLDGAIPQRPGPRAKSIHYNVPQREKNLNEYHDPEIREAYFAAFSKLAGKYSNALEWRTSVMEKRGNALFLKSNQTIPTVMAPCRGEIGHIHESDMSGHLLLSFADAKEVLAKGWGERHRMSGGSFIPLGYTMLYVPRNLQELDVFMRIFEASIKFAMSSGKKA